MLGQFVEGFTFGARSPPGVGEGAVDEQIRITPDGGRKVGVVGFCQAVVTEAFGGVDGPLERAKKGDLESVAIGTARQNFEDFLNFPSLGEIPGLDPVGDQELAVLLQAGLFGHLVNSVQRRAMFPVEMAGHRFIGEKHELLDELMGLVGRFLLNPVGPAFWVQQHP